MYDLLFQPVETLISLKQSANAALGRLGIEKVRDLLFYKPYNYRSIKVEPNLQDVRDGDEIVITARVDDVQINHRQKSLTKVYVTCKSGGILLVFFNKIPTFLFVRLRVGSTITITGKVQFSDGYLQINHPDFVLDKKTITPSEPVYNLTYGITNRQLYSYIARAMDAFEISVKARLHLIKKPLQESNIIYLDEKKYITHLLDLLKNLHKIKIDTHIDEVAIRKELSALELVANQFALSQVKTANEKNEGNAFRLFHQEQKFILDNLGFELTSDQRRSIDEIEADQVRSKQMMRLLQGDVGSGKTLVALFTMLNVALSGFQTCLMAPTDLLSNQHYNFFSNVLVQNNLEIEIALLTGKTKAKERKAILEGLEDGRIKILIGTHALFQENIMFKNLGYVVIDEQHKFGVQQRLDLINKATHPDLLVMTATPIPRSLTLTMFGDMSTSQIKTKPKNRLPIITTVVPSTKRLEIMESLQRKLAMGEKIYWICPLIDQSDKSLEENTDEAYSYADVTTSAIEIEKYYPAIVGVLHGKMKPQEKEEIMQKFNSGDFKILVATTVVEVGIDVRDATLIIIENAERFGLAQLHQLRGRVGRGPLQSHCLLMYNPKRTSKIGHKRLAIMKESNDGFYIAEQDLLLRGAGEILGTKQSGEPEFYFTDLVEDLKLLTNANKIANELPRNELTLFQVKLFARDNSSLAKSG